MKKVSIKSVSAAVVLALAGFSGTAHAQAASDLYLEVYDPTSQDTFVADLGSPLTAAGSATDINLSKFAAWSTFEGDATGAESTWEYVLLGGNTATGAGDTTNLGTLVNGFYSTGDLAGEFAANSPNMKGAVIGTSTLSAVGGPGVNWTFVNVVGANGDYGTGYGQTVYGTGANPLNFYYVNSTGNGVTLLGTLSADFSANQIDVVPEPGTYALMAAGLLAVGTIVRRRSRG
jgi:hypothetical protein